MALDDPCTVVLRAGRGQPLFLFSGGGADHRELDPLVAALQTRRPLVGIRYWEAGQDGALPATVEEMADAAVKSVRSLQQGGPYLLAGYSQGGLVALEVARRLIDQGESVRPPILIDALPHRSAWPLPILMRAGIRYMIYRAFGRPRTVAVGGPVLSADAESAERCREARAKYRPVRYDGPVTLIHASREPYVGGLAPVIWRRLALRVDSHSVQSRHLDLMAVDSAVAATALVLDRSASDAPNEAGSRRALVVTGLSWESTARLVGELARVGFMVEVIAPAGHPVLRLDRLAAFYPLRALRALKSVEAAIMESRPDVLVPGDDFVVGLLHRLHATTRDGGIRELVRRSLGEPAFYARKLDRCWMIGAAASEGVQVPRTVGLKSISDLDQQLAKIGCPAFLKIDGTWGGTGVARVDSLADAKRAWRRLASPFQVLRAVKRALFNGDLTGVDWALRRQRPVFSLQATQDGQLVIVSAVCHRGQLLGMISARVLSQQSAFGPAKTIQLDDRLPVRDAVGRVVRHLGLSGFCGFDFILPADADACFIELNARATQTSTIVGERDGDPLAALLDALGGTGRPREPVHSNGDIVTLR